MLPGAPSAAISIAPAPAPGDSLGAEGCGGWHRAPSPPLPPISGHAGGYPDTHTFCAQQQPLLQRPQGLQPPRHTRSFRKRDSLPLDRFSVHKYLQQLFIFFLRAASFSPDAQPAAFFPMNHEENAAGLKNENTECSSMGSAMSAARAAAVPAAGSPCCPAGKEALRGGTGLQLRSAHGDQPPGQQTLRPRQGLGPPQARGFRAATHGRVAGS